MRTLVLTLLLALSGQASAANVGFAHITGLPFDLAVWYPANAPASPQPLELFTQTVAPDAPPAPGKHPFVVIAHGNGGSLGGHYDTALALAEAGYVVAAPTFVHDNYRDHADELKLWKRPPQIVAAIDAVLHTWSGHDAVDPARIGIFGFSAGGFTALVLIGGKPDFSKLDTYCHAKPQEFVCTLRKQHPNEPPRPNPIDWVADKRIRAAVIAAPGLGFTFGKETLADVRVPVQLWAAGNDHILPVPDNAEAVREALPAPPEYRVLPGAEHLDFLAPCSPALARVAPPICADHGFDRAAFHQQFNVAVVQFFDAHLK